MPGWAFLFWDGTTLTHSNGRDSVVMPGWAFLFWDMLTNVRTLVN